MILLFDFVNNVIYLVCCLKVLKKILFLKIKVNIFVFFVFCFFLIDDILLFDIFSGLFKLFRMEIILYVFILNLV